MARRTRGGVADPADEQHAADAQHAQHEWAEWEDDTGVGELDIDDDRFDEDGGLRYDDRLPPRRRGRGLLVFLAVLAILAGAALLATRWVQRQIDPPGPAGEKVAVVVPSGASTAKIAALLQRSGVISNATMFRYYAQFKGKGNFEAGKYEFRRNDTFERDLDVLTEGPQIPDQVKITIPEGFRLDQVAARVAAQMNGHTKEAFLAEAASGKVRSDFLPPGATNLEGVLFPETYSVTLEDTDAAILSRMVDGFDQVATDVGLGEAQQLVGVTPYEAIVVASMVEREAKVDEDRPKIARVIYNRLKAEMNLQIDATVIYAITHDQGREVERVTDDDLKVDSPYNTYKVKGLPPGPIAMPGRASLEAALHPAVGDWLYYVVTSEDGSHSFAVTFKEHRANIREAKKKGLR